jgi:hypothetical protein
LVDFELDDGDGIELASWLLESRRVDRVLFYTGERSDHPDVRRAQRLGPVLSKADPPGQILTALGLDAKPPLPASEQRAEQIEATPSEASKPPRSKPSHAMPSEVSKPPRSSPSHPKR